MSISEMSIDHQFDRSSSFGEVDNSDQILDFIEKEGPEILSSIKNIYNGLLPSTEEGDFGWQVCTSTCIALGAILSARFQIPLSLSGITPRLSIIPGVYAKEEDGVVQFINHASMFLYGRDNSITYIDPIHALTFGDNRADLKEAITIVRTTSSTEMENLLQAQNLELELQPRRSPYARHINDIGTATYPIFTNEKTNPEAIHTSLVNPVIAKYVMNWDLIIGGVHESLTNNYRERLNGWFAGNRKRRFIDGIRARGEAGDTSVYEAVKNLLEDLGIDNYS